MKKVLEVWCVEKSYGMIIVGKLEHDTQIVQGDSLPEVLDTVLHNGVTLMNIGDSLEIRFVNEPKA